MNIRINTLLLCWLLLMGTARADGLDARLDRARVAEGETVVLTLVAPGETNGSPDLSPLDADFDLINQAQSTRMSIINGSRSSTREWQLVLAPKRTGKLWIPALRLGGQSSPPQTLEVLPQSQAARLGEARPLLLEVEVEPGDPYVQGQVIYTVRVLARISPRQAGLSDPRAEGALIERLGEDRSFSTTRNGQTYQVIERRYALFPQHSGRLEIEPPVLTAQVPQSGRRRSTLRDRMFGSDLIPDMDGFFEQTRSVRLRGRSLYLDVRPRPVTADSHWLPAQSLELSQAWSPEPPEFRVGEPVTLSIAITAQGLTAAQLPDLQMAVPDGVKLYPDKPQAQTRPENDTLIAQKVLKAAIVPSRPGRLTLPELRLAWWDTDTDTPRMASLPAISVDVLPARTGSPAPVPTPQPAQAPGGSVPVMAVPRISPPESELVQASLAEPDRVIPSAYWPWIAVGLVLAWLVTLALWLRERRRGRSAATGSLPASAAQSPNLAKSREQVRQACRANDPRAARAALLRWAAARWPRQPPRRLDELAVRLDGAARPLLREMDRCLYSDDAGSWQGMSAWAGLQAALKAAASEKDGHRSSTVLPDLYSGTA